jgi:ketosteroid isomerase-like protein
MDEREGCPMPDDIFLINKAKTEFRDGYNDGNIEQVPSLFDPFMVEMSQGELTGFGERGLTLMRQRLSTLFSQYGVKMVPIIIDVAVHGSTAYDFGWHEITLTPKVGGRPLHQRLRYLEHWKKNAGGEWKITFFVSNEDRKETLNGMQPRWFINEDEILAS